MRSLFLATSLATAYALLRGWPDGLHPVLRACLAVLALVIGLALWRRKPRRTATRATAIRPAQWSDYVAMGLGVLAVEFLFLFFLTIAPPKAEALALSLEETLNPEAAAARARTNAPDNSAGMGRNSSGNWLWDSLGRRQLPNKTDARPGNKPEVFFRSSNATTTAALLHRRPYIQAFALDVYEDATWSPLPITPQTLTPDSSGTVNFPRLAKRPGPVLKGSVFHSANPSGQDVLTTIQYPLTVKQDGMRQVGSGIIRLAPLANPDDGYDYETSSLPLTLNHLADLGLAQNLQPGRNQPNALLDLPSNPTLRDQLLQIANQTQGPLELRLAAIRKFLRANCTYSLEVTNPDNLDPIDNFLSHEKRGHCEFFATTAALLCRALNIPSRVAYGWAGGRYFQSQNLFMFRAREAHAWTEIYLDGYGWTIFDCTPPGALDAASSSVANPGEQAPLGDDQTPEEEETEAATIGRWPWIILGAALTLIPLTILLLASRKKPATNPTTGTPTLIPDPPNYLKRFKQACHRQGHPMPPGRTLRQQLSSLAKQNITPQFAQDLLQYHYTTTYGSQEPNKQTEKHLTKLITTW